MDSITNDLHRKRAKHLLLYLIYAEIVLVTGVKLMAFHKQTIFSEAEIAAAQKSAFGSPTAQAPVNPTPLPDGILVFDAETKQTTVHEGEAQANYIFNLSNASKKPVVINSVKTSCGCTVAKVPPLPWTLKPQDKGQIAVTMNVLGSADKSTKTVTVYTDQGSKPLTVVAIITPAEKPK
jgi:hypothetical protein